MSAIPRDSVFSKISSLMSELNGESVKTASAQTKQATEMGMSGEGKKDPGGYKGPSTHPSARSASNVESAPLGSRAKENEKDVKDDNPAGVDNTAPKSGGSQDDKQLSIGTKQRAVGEMPEVEDHYKGDKDDKREGDMGGTEGPFNAEDIGEKYSSVRTNDLVKVAFSQMNDILADIANGETFDAEPAAAPATKTAATTQPAGDTDMQKVAAAQAIIKQTIQDAQLNADLVGEYLSKYAANYTQNVKQAEGGPMGDAMAGGPGGDAPPPPDAAAAGGAPTPPPAGGGEGGAGGPEGGLDEFISALLQMGLTPDQIEQALQEVAGGGAGGAGAPGGEGGGAPTPPPDMAGAAGGGAMGEGLGKTAADRELARVRKEMAKFAGVAAKRFRSGEFNFRPVTPGTKEAQERKELQSYILEVCGVRA